MGDDETEMCEWCGMPIEETDDQCPARDPGIECDPDPYDELGRVE